MRPLAIIWRKRPCYYHRMRGSTATRKRSSSTCSSRNANIWLATSKRRTPCSRCFSAGPSSDLLRVEVHCLRIKLYEVSGRYGRGLEVALNALRAFGVAFPDGEQDVEAAVDAQLRCLPVNLAGRAIGDLVEAPVVSDPVNAAMIDRLV